MRACCVPHCKLGKKVLSDKFPKDPIRCHKWIKSLRLHHLENLCANELQKYQICYKHFHEEDYNCSLINRFLLNTAILFVHINYNDDNINVIDVNTINNMQ